MQPLSPCGQGWEAHGGLPEREDPQAESGWSLGAEEQSPHGPLGNPFPRPTRHVGDSEEPGEGLAEDACGRGQERVRWWSPRITPIRAKSWIPAERVAVPRLPEWES